MTFADRIRWLVEAFRTVLLAWRKVKPVVDAASAGNKGGGDVMQAISIDNLKAAQAFLNTDPRAKAILAAAQALAGGDGESLIKLLKGHQWGAAAVVGITDALTIANAAGVPFAGLALKLLPVAVFMAQHPHNSGENGIGALPEGNQSVNTGA